MNIILNTEKSYKLTELAQAVQASNDDLLYVVQTIDGQEVSIAIRRDVFLAGVGGSIGTGSSFPLIPDSWQQFRRTDLNNEIFEYDPVRLKWLSVHTYSYQNGSSSASAGNLTLTNNYNNGAAGAPVIDDMTIVRFAYGSEANASMDVQIETVGTGGSIVYTFNIFESASFITNNMDINVNSGVKIRVNQANVTDNSTRPSATIFFKRRAT